MPLVSLREEAIIRDGLIRAKDIARLLGVTTAWLRALAKEGHIPPVDRGCYPLVETVRRFSRYYRRKAHQKAQRFDRAEIALMEARTRLINVRCDAIERGNRGKNFGDG